MKQLLSATFALLLLTAAAAPHEQLDVQPSYTIRVTATTDVRPIVEVLELEADDSEAREFTQKQVPFEIEIDARKFEAEFLVDSEEGIIKVVLLHAGNTHLTGIGKWVELSHDEDGGELRAGMSPQ